MNYLINIVLISRILIFAQQCGRDDMPEGTPACLQERIKEIAREEVWNPPAKIYSYYYGGKKVYFIPQRCCDIPSQLFDERCHVICAPDGGFSGKGDGGCDDFFVKRSGEELVWEDPRK
jgi:hypothetical protein